MLLAVYRAKWNLARLALAGALLLVMIGDTAGRMARAQLAALPSFNYAQEVDALRAQGRYGEAVVIADAGLADPGLSGADRTAIAQARAGAVEERDSFLRKAGAVGLGALSGEGDSLEALIGAVATDFFVVGDIRDLVVQGGKQMIDGDSDNVVLTLSAIGLVTTLAPEVDWVPSLLKAAAKSGNMSRRMGEYLKAAIKGRRTPELLRLFDDVKVIASHASPGGAVRLMKHVDGPAEVGAVARYLERTGSPGVFALHVTGKQGVAMVAQGSEQLLVRASRKGRAGAALLRTPWARGLTRPHLLTGLAKAAWKGNAEKVLTRLIDRMDAGAWWAIPALAGWVVVELGWLVGRLTSRKRREPASSAGTVAKAA